VPYPLLAHQAPVLPLKVWWPAAFNGTALALGSIAPDLQNFWNDARGSVEFGHTLSGQFEFCMPLAVGVVLLVGHLDLGAVLAARLGTRARRLVGVATDVGQVGGVRRAVTSALVGSCSHVAFDKLTHETLPDRFPPAVFHVDRIVFSMHAVSQVAVSVVGAAVTLWLVRSLPWRTSGAPTARGGAALIVIFAFAGAAVGLVRSAPAIHHPDWYFEAGRVYVWGYVAFLVLTAMLAGALVAATILACWDQLTRARC
jgi:hypothetical protein